MKQEPERDLELAAALRRLEGDAELDDAAWRRLQARIATDAARHFAAPEKPIAWWEYIAGWARPALPLAAAAGLLLLLLTQLGIGDNRQAAQTTHLAAVDQAGLAMIVFGDVPEQEAVSALVGPSDRGWLVESVMGGTEQ